MDIRFGLALDGAPAQPAINRLGYICVGPLGMLAILETELGLTAPRVELGTRVAQYHAGLKACNKVDRFYHRSFEADPLGVSRTLLEWRDDWHLAGWTGAAPEQSPLRLRDMAAVEALVLGNLKPGIGERLAAVLKALEDQRTQITTIELVDGIEEFPLRWQQVLAKLPCQTRNEIGPCSDANDLSRLRQGLLSMVTGKSEATPFTFANDASIRIFGTDSRPVLARYLATLIAEKAAPAAIVAEQESSLLDEVIAATGLPRAGMAEASPLLPALQLLPLTLDLMWNPLDVTTLLEFLTHPMTPVDKSLARELARQVSKSPGTGGAGWNKILGKDPSLDRKQKEPASFWLMSPRHSRSDGLPIDEVRVRLQALADHHGRRLALLSGDEVNVRDQRTRESVVASLSQCRQFLGTLELFAGSGESRLSPRILQQMYDLAASGTSTFGAIAELGHTPFVSNPAALVEPFDTVVWWQMGAPNLPRAYPWSAGEIEALNTAGVRLPSLDQQLQWMTRTWLRPILAARSQLILVLPPAGEERHPLWPFICEIAKGIESCSSDGVTGAGQNVTMVEVIHKPLPALRRWWELPDNVAIPKRDKESASSLGILFDSPYRWVLNYPARLRESEILVLPDGPTLFGVLLHRLTELYFKSEEWAAHDQAAVDRWFDVHFDALMETEGQTLNQPGRQAELVRFREQGRRALQELIVQLKAAGITAVQTESPVDGDFKGGKLAGSADMIVHNASNQAAIVDLKWSDYADKYTKLLASNQHLQLAIYAQLLSRKAGGIALAYYILSKARLIAQTNDFFPKARLVPNGSEETVAHLWQRFETSWTWRRGQLDHGRVEVVTEQTVMDEDSTPPEEALRLNEPNDRYNSYRFLAGWGRQA